MKIIHTADLHLGSSLNGFPKSRSNELIQTFRRMLEYAKEHHIYIILIAGDLFDSKNVDIHLKEMVYSLFKQYEDITFFYLKGNHDVGNDVEVLDNVKTFDQKWTYYRFEKLCIAGCERTDSIHKLKLHEDYHNVVLLHGDVQSTISLKQLANKNIDYLALGHIHQYSTGKLDQRGNYVYPGCLEGRGYDEKGDKGFVVYDTTTKQHTFIPFASRKFIDLEVDVEGCNSEEAIIHRLLQQLEKKNKNYIYDIHLTGNIDVGASIDLEYISNALGSSSNIYTFRISDETSYEIDFHHYLNDPSIKGEFVRRVYASNEENKEEIIHYGLNALLKGEI